MSLTQTSPSAVPAPAPRTLIVRPWIDPLVDAVGHPPDGLYVELFWLGILGPTTTWLVRRIASGLDSYPDGYELDLVETAAALGLSSTPGRHGPFIRALDRCVMFGIAHRTTEGRCDGLALRRRIPPLANRQVDRLPDHLRLAHGRWSGAPVDHASDHRQWDRATTLAHAFLQAGDEPAGAERHLIAVGVTPVLARQAIDASRHLAHDEWDHRGQTAH